LAKGMKIEVSGNIRTGSYVNKDGRTIKTFELIVNDQEFAESQKKNAEIYANNHQSQNDVGGDAELPFE
jgi:single-strand DNA-binding protein